MSTKKPKETPVRLEQQGERIFALDIGTRTVVGVVGEQIEEEFALLDYIVEPHSKRAMIDGQIEDVRQVSKVVTKVKQQLEQLTGIELTKVSIAAAGRALRTHRTVMEFDISDRDYITSDMVKSMEIETIQKAQSELDEAIGNHEKTAFYCVGYSVTSYLLDDYKMLSLEAHKGKAAAVELIATFLPGVVVDGLYSVMDMNGLSVASLTLEPIAAMNVVVPPEIRAINIALVDIGAGTSDIAISSGGSVVAYAMATTAGDEITEEIIKTFFVDFQTAEAMKQTSTSGAAEIQYRDIFGITQTVNLKEFTKKTDKAVGHLADAICEHIVSANKAPPAAVFLVGGGSLITGLSAKVAKKLELDEARVAIGNQSQLRSVDTRGRELGAEFVTPIGIALTAILNRGYDFSVITLNNEKIRVFDTKKLSVFDLLTMSGCKTADIMGRSGRSLIFTVNGKRRVIKGGSFTPSAVAINGEPASLNASVTQGDRVEFTPAVSGESAAMTLDELIREFGGGGIIDSELSVLVNGREEQPDYSICSFDKVEISMGALAVEPGGSHDYDNEYSFSGRPIEMYTETTPEQYGSIVLTLNDKELILPATEDRSPHTFLELLNHAEIDTDSGITGYTMLLNGAPAGFGDFIKAGDIAVLTTQSKE